MPRSQIIPEMELIDLTNVPAASSTDQHPFAAPEASVAAGRQPSPAKNWVYTFNYGRVGQPTLEQVTDFIAYVDGKTDYHVAGFELAPSTGQPHLQGYFQLSNKLRKSQLIKWPGAATVYFAVARGSDKQCRDYCLGYSHGKSSATDFHEFGEATTTDAGARERERWVEALDVIKRGRFEDLEPQIQICHAKACEFLIQRYRERPSDLLPGTKHTWIWGPTGTGKSRGAREMLTTNYGPNFYLKLHNKWWDFYDGHEGVLIDDLGKDVGKALVNYLKQWLDMYVFPAEMKGGVSGRGIRPKSIVITSNFHPYDIWGGTEDYDPLMRRLDVVYKGRDGEEPPYRGPAQLVLPQPDFSLVTPEGAARVVPHSSMTTVVVNRDPVESILDDM